MSNPTRATEIEIDEVAGGFLVYHPSRDRVHYLNHTAALVLELCTGEASADEIARMLQVAYELPTPPEGEIGECLEQLKQEGLVRGDPC
jgi:Coenzyme PQQ synthesis protein D (PqqD)